MSKTQEGFILIADITGYTLYLSQSELEHAQEILTSLLELVLKNTRPPLIISRLAGDAVISYGLGEHFLQGQTFVEMIEITYIAFKKAIEQMVRNNNCQCNACANIASLDLKFFVHYGKFGLQHISDHDELVGSDVNLIHRLLKNHVTEKTGFKAYTLYTEAALNKLGIEGFIHTMQPISESYEFLGEVPVWVQDMQPVWTKKRTEQQIRIPANQINTQVEVEIQMPPEMVWSYLIQPEYRKILMGVEKNDVIGRQNGRVAPGSVYHCYHGDHITPQMVIEWQPFERIVTQDQMPLPKTHILTEYRLEPTANGTRLTQAFSKARGPLGVRNLNDLVIRKMMKQGDKDLRAFKEKIEADFAAQLPIPDIPLSISTQEIREAVHPGIQER